MSILKLADGTEINTATGKRVEKIEPVVEDSSAPALFEPASSERKLEDLPTNPQQMNVIGAVLSYVFIGLPTFDICMALGCSAEQLEAIMASEAYDRTRALIIESFVRGQTNTAREILSTGAIQSARQVIEIATKSKNEQNRLKAADLVLKATGVSGDDINSAMSQGLVIKVIKAEAPTNISIKVG